MIGTIARVLIALATMGFHFVHAKGAPAFTDDRWNPAHVDKLSPVLRTRLQAAAPVCGPAEAEHFIVTYIQAEKAEYAMLHFENLRCAKREVICRDGRCLHEVYKIVDGQSRRVLQTYVRELRLNRVGDSAVVESDCGSVVCHPVRLP